MNLQRNRFIPVTLLLGVTIVWGSAFAIMKDTLDRQDVNSFLACRFIIAAGIMLLLRPQCLKHMNKDFLIRGVVTGTFLGTGYIFQTFGLTMTTVAKTGFLTGLYAVIVPLIAAGFFKAKVRKLQSVSYTHLTLPTKA